MIKLERREDAGFKSVSLAYLIALLLGFLTSALLIHLSGASVFEGFSTLFEGAFGSRDAVLESLVSATPLILTGLATVIAFRAQIWNIGQEGQMFAGAMSAYWASLYLETAPAFIAVPLIVLAGILGGVTLGALSGYLKARFNVNEIISTVMLNYVVIYLLSFLLAGGPWMEVGDSVSYHQSGLLADNHRLPILVEGSKLHLGFVLALAAAVICYLIIERTPLGYEFRALGQNPTALRFKGTNVPRTIVLVMAVSGGIAALAGVTEIFGLNHRLKGDVMTGLGYTGIIIGMIGGLRPIGAVLAGLFFGGLANGALYMKILSGVPSALVPAMQGIILLFFLCAGVIVRYRVVKVSADA
jgi:simple sugar transport system permease protein